MRKEDAKRVVRDGYDAIALRYLEERVQKETDTADIDFVEVAVAALPAGARVLDAGCGGGVPVARMLLWRFSVCALDFTKKQLELARENVPRARLVRGELSDLPFVGSSFDAVVSLYAVIHVPREEHSQVFEEFHRVLRPGGRAILCLGAQDLEEDLQEDYHGSPMYWSHHDSATNSRMVDQAGFRVERESFVADADGSGSRHLFLVAMK